MVDDMTGTTAAELRKSGYWGVEEVRDAFTRIQDSLEEAKGAETVEHIANAAAKGNACFCAATSCQQGCPLSKEVPSIMEALREVDFDLINKEFADVQKELDTYLEDFKDLSFEEYFAQAREGYVKRLNQILEEKPELKQALNKLKSAYKLQVSATRNGGIAKNPFPEFTGMLCPAPCEDGGPEGPGCTLKESGKREPVRIRSTEWDLAEIGFALGWMDDVFLLPASLKPKDETVAVIGSGPGGLQTAYGLAMKGYNVTLMEKDDEIGGQMYRGIPNHKFEKERLAKYRVLLEQMGVKIELNLEVTPQDLEGFDAKVIATGVMDGQIEPTWVPGYADAKEGGLVQDACSFLRGGNEWASERTEDQPFPDHDAVPQGKQVVLAYGDGYTATDVVQTLARMKQQNHDIIPIHAFRDTGVSDKVAGGFSISEAKGDYKKHHLSASEDDKLNANIVKIPGANIESITPKSDDKAEVHFKFQKPETGYANVARNARRRNMEPDELAGGIYRGETLVGLRVREPDGAYHDHAYEGDGQFSAKPSAESIAGDVDGTLMLEVNRLIPAMGAKDASKNPLVKAMDVNAGAYHNEPDDKQNREGIWNGVAMSQEGTFFVGDAGHNEQLIVSAQASANQLVDTVDRYLDIKRQEQPVDLAALASASNLSIGARLA